MAAIDVVLVTWPNHPKRMEYLRETYRALREKLTASRHELRWLCSSESEPDPDAPWLGDTLVQFCADERLPLTWHYGPASLGAGMNTALRACTADLIFLVQDDYLLCEPLDLSDGADVLLANEPPNMIRYSFPPHEYGIKFLPSPYPGFVQVDTFACWCYGDDPALRHRRILDRYGWFTEGIGHGAEGDMVLRLQRAHANILAAERCYFTHAGEVSAIPARLEKRKRSISR